MPKMFIQLDDRKTDEFAKSASNGRFSSCLPVLIDNLNTLTDIAAYVAIRRNAPESELVDCNMIRAKKPPSGRRHGFCLTRYAA